MSIYPQFESAHAGSPSGERKVRVVLADGHIAMRRRLRLLLDNETSVEVIAEAGDLAGLLDQVHHNLVDVLVVDLGLLDGASLEAIHQLREQVPVTEIVVLSMEASWAVAREVLMAGAIGFVLKQGADAELLQAVRNGARGKRYLSPRVSAGFAAAAQG